MLFDEHIDQLFDLLVYAKENIEFYRELYKDIELNRETFDYDFFRNQIPIIRKDDITKSKFGNLADKYIEDRSKIQIERTSGSTGTPFVCYKDNRTRVSLATNLMEFRKLYSSDFNVNSRYASFYGIISIDGVRRSNEIFIHKNTLYIPVLNLDNEHLVEIWNAICDYKPLWLMGTCTAVYYLAKCVAEQKLPFYKFGFIELNGELVSKTSYEYIKEIFQCSVNNHYGMRELWCIGYSCPKGHIHISNKTLFVEDVRNEEIDDNVLVCTSLTNRVAPFIRYEIGDRGTVIYEPDCEFNGTNYTVDVSSGRISCFFECGGKMINLFIFALIIKNIVDEEGRNKIIRYQVQKTAETSLNIKVELSNYAILTDKDIERIQGEVIKFSETSIDVHVEAVEIIKAENNGKVPEYVDLTKKRGGSIGIKKS